MTKLQMIKRANGSESYSSNLPIAMIKDLGWEKGDDLTIEVVDHKITIFRGVREDGGD